MIAHLRGKLISRHPNEVIVETMGVGYDVTISVPTFSELPPAGSEVALHIHTHVREDQIALYGFLRPEEKQLFEKLITVSGIGPKLAIIEKYQGGPVGVNTLAAALAEEPDAIEEIYEPFLIQIGFLNRTPRGRVATQLAYEHFGITPTRRQSSLF